MLFDFDWIELMIEHLAIQLMIVLSENFFSTFVAIDICEAQAY